MAGMRLALRNGQRSHLAGVAFHHGLFTTILLERPNLKERNVDLSFYEPLYTSIVLEYNNYIIQGALDGLRLHRKDTQG